MTSSPQIIAYVLCCMYIYCLTTILGARWSGWINVDPLTMNKIVSPLIINVSKISYRKGTVESAHCQKCIGTILFILIKSYADTYYPGQRQISSHYNHSLQHLQVAPSRRLCYEGWVAKMAKKSTVVTTHVGDRECSKIQF